MHNSSLSGVSLAAHSDGTENSIGCVLTGNAAVFIDQIPGIHRLRAVSAIGESFPLHCTANGKALLSLLPDDEWTKLVGRSPRAYTSHTITDLARLKQEIDECRRTQIAQDREEHTEGITAVGTAFFDPLGRPLALSVPVPTTRFERMESRLTTELKHVRRKIEGLLSAP